MADNVAITPGSGSTIATDDVGGVHYQTVKLDVGGDGVSVPVEDALPVRQTGLITGVLQKITTVSTSAVAVPATALTGRASIVVQNVGSTTIYLGSATVTADTAATGGIQLAAGATLPYPVSLSDAVDLYAISSGAGGLVATLEAA